MAIVQRRPIQNGKYFIKNRGADIYWSTWNNSIETVYFYLTTIENAKSHYKFLQWDITHDANGNLNISMTSPLPSSCQWVGTEIKGSTVPVPWRLIPADSKSYYLTTDMNRDSQNPRVPAAQYGKGNAFGSMAILKEGDQSQMWEFIRI